MNASLIARLANICGPSKYRREFLREQAVLPSIAGLPRVIRSFIGV